MQGGYAKLDEEQRAQVVELVLRVLQTWYGSPALMRAGEVLKRRISARVCATPCARIRVFPLTARVLFSKHVPSCVLLS